MNAVIQSRLNLCERIALAVAQNGITSGEPGIDVIALAPVAGLPISELRRQFFRVKVSGRDSAVETLISFGEVLIIFNQFKTWSEGGAERLPDGITKLSGKYRICFTDDEAAELWKGIAVTMN
jgi:hypothetical protein